MKNSAVGRTLEQVLTLQGGVSSFGGGRVKKIRNKEIGMEMEME